MADEKLIRRKDLRVPNDLDVGGEPQCNTDAVWQIPKHEDGDGNQCCGSYSLVYTTGLTDELPPKAPCSICGRVFVQ